MNNNTQLFKWVNCYERVPTITKYYSIRDGITGQYGSQIYCDRKDTIQLHCLFNGFDFNDFEWLEEVPNVQGETYSFNEVLNAVYVFSDEENIEELKETVAGFLKAQKALDELLRSKKAKN